MVLFAARSRCIFFVMRTEPIQVLSETELLGHKFTVYGTAENPLFLAKEVAECIDYAKTSQGYYDVSRMVGTVDEEEKDLRTIFVDGRNYEMWFLTEDGLYEVLMQSRKPIAKVFNVEILFGIGIVHLVLLLNQNIKYESKSKINRGFGGCNSPIKHQLST